MDRDVVDSWMKTEDHESLNLARELIRQEGLLCGGSSGAALSVALKIGKDLSENKRIVVLLPDGIRNYMTKFVSDEWMAARDFGVTILDLSYINIIHLCYCEHIVYFLNHNFSC